MLMGYVYLPHGHLRRRSLVRPCTTTQLDRPRTPLTMLLALLDENLDDVPFGENEHTLKRTETAAERTGQTDAPAEQMLDAYFL